jgi:hypothetical protein
VNVILICYRHSQMLELCHFSKDLLPIYIMVLSCSPVAKHEHILNGI